MNLLREMFGAIHEVLMCCSLDKIRNNINPFYSSEIFVSYKQQYFLSYFNFNLVHYQKHNSLLLLKHHSIQYQNYPKHPKTLY